MAAKAGVWIDHKQAFVVLVTDAGQETKTVQSGIEASGRPAGSNSKSKYTPNDFVAEDRLERKVASHRKKYYDDVAACVRGAKAVLILGPGEAKGEFMKHIQGKKAAGVVAELETADKMTARQLAAKVNQHFAASSAKKSVVPKEPAKKTAKTTAGKRPKKSGK